MYYRHEISEALRQYHLSTFFLLLQVDAEAARLVKAIKSKFTHITQWLVSKFRGEDRRNLYRIVKSSEREFRLLRILPKSTSVLLEAELVYSSLDDVTLRYEAFSYTWDGSLRLYRIILNGKLCLVTKNLAIGLAHLQLRDAERLVWIDALCIDQSSPTERSEQVSMMRDIYLNAREGVVIWLGGNSPASGFLKRAELHENPEAWLKNTIRNDIYKLEWIFVQKLFERTYWERVWIIQEIACASSISVLCGDDCLNWGVLVAANSVWVSRAHLNDDLSAWYLWGGWHISLLYAAFDSKREPLKNILKSFQRDFIGPNLLEATRILNHSAERPSLLDLMCIHYDAKATDPRDKVYALVGIAATCNNARLSTDYSLSELSVAKHVSDFLINSAKTLDLICFGLPCLPRFMPESYDELVLWDRLSFKQGWYENSTLGVLRSIGTGLEPNTGSLLPKYAAAGTTLPVAQLPIRRKMRFKILGNLDREVMTVKGCCVDTIAGFLSEFSEEPGAFEPWLPCLKAISPLKRDETTLKYISVTFLIIAKAGALALLFTVILIPLLALLLDMFKFHDPIGQLLKFLALPYGHNYPQISTLGLPMTDPTFLAYPPGSSEWLGSHHLIAMTDNIKRQLLLAMKTSTASSSSRNRQLTTRVERLDSFWRTLIGNRTAEGATPPPEWADVFNVILNGPSFAPSNLSDFNGASPSEIGRARAYVGPFFEALLTSLPDRKLVITTRGMLGLASGLARKGDMICVFLGCSFPVVVQARGKNDMRNILRSGAEIDGNMCGSAYLSGYMEGRAVSEMADGTLETRSFRLH